MELSSIPAAGTEKNLQMFSSGCYCNPHIPPAHGLEAAGMSQAPLSHADPDAPLPTEAEKEENCFTAERDAHEGH